MQMRQLLQNLIGNALKFHRPDTPPVVEVCGRIETEEDGDPVCILDIQDNGIGFSDQYVDRIFAPFQRLHSREKYQGTGIGLAICRRIAERHNGAITARSTPGKGSVFTVRLPVHQPEASGKSG
jgi:signal transduction histidine kinase